MQWSQLVWFYNTTKTRKSTHTQVMTQRISWLCLTDEVVREALGLQCASADGLDITGRDRSLPDRRLTVWVLQNAETTMLGSPGIERMNRKSPDLTVSAGSKHRTPQIISIKFARSDMKLLFSSVSLKILWSEALNSKCQPWDSMGQWQIRVSKTR